MGISEQDFQDIKKKIANFVKKELLENEKQFGVEAFSRRASQFLES